MLGYLEFFNKLGLLFEDKELMALLQDHLQKNYALYELQELFQVYKLVSLSFYRNSEVVSTIQDIVKIRFAMPEQRQSPAFKYNPNLSDLIQGQMLQT